MPRFEDPLLASAVGFALLVLGRLPTIVAAMWIAGQHGSARTLAIAGAAIATAGWVLLGWIDAAGQIAGPWLWETLGPATTDRIDDVIDASGGVGLALALVGVALGSVGSLARAGAVGGAVLCALGTILRVALAPPALPPGMGVAPLPSWWPVVLALLPVGMLVAALARLIDAPPPATPEPMAPRTAAWTDAGHGIRRFGIALLLFMIVGVVLARLARVAGPAAAGLMTMVGHAVSVGLLAMATHGLWQVARAPDGATASWGRAGLVGGIAAALGTVGTLALSGAMEAGLIDGYGASMPSESVVGATGWLVAMVGAAAASGAIGRRFGHRGLVGLAVVAIGCFAVGAVLNAIPPRAWERLLGGATEAAPFIGPVLALPGVILTLVLVLRAATVVDEAASAPARVR